MKAINKTLLGLLSIVIAHSSVQAFDNHREGLLLSLGVGMSQTFHQPYKKNSHNGIGTSQKIGYGVNNQLILHLSREDAWFNYKDELHVSCLPVLQDSW